MPPSRLTRFLNLERPRPPATEAPREVVNKARFGGEPPLEIAADPGDQPFVRCPSCEADNNKQAERCFNCQRPLQHEDVRAWNAAFWERRKVEAPLEAPPPPAPLSEADRQLAEALAASVAQRERTRLWWWGDEVPDTTPAGMKLLGLIRDGNTRTMVALGMGATFLASAAVALAASGHPVLRGVAGAVAAVLLVIFLPGTRRRSRWWDWD